MACNIDLEKYKVQNLEPTAYYISEFLTSAEERSLLAGVYSAPKPKWTQLSGRRVQSWGGDPHERGMLAEPLPPWLLEAARRVPGLPPPNHVLVNEYLPGQGILPHEDGALFHPCVATLSTGSHAVLRLLRPEGDRRVPAGQLLLEPRSLLLLRDRLYTGHLHGIDELHGDLLDESVLNLHMCSAEYERGATVARGTRVSLTIRHVPRATAFRIHTGGKR